MLDNDHSGVNKIIHIPNEKVNGKTQDEIDKREKDIADELLKSLS